MTYYIGDRMLDVDAFNSGIQSITFRIDQRSIKNQSVSRYTKDNPLKGSKMVAFLFIVHYLDLLIVDESPKTKRRTRFHSSPTISTTFNGAGYRAILRNELNVVFLMNHIPCNQAAVRSLKIDPCDIDLDISNF